MNARIITFVACRLFAVYVLIMYGVNFMLQLLIAALSPYQEGSEAALSHYVLTASVAAALYVLLAFGLWSGASAISRTVSAPVPEKLEDKPAGDRWQAMVIACIGWLTLLLAVGQMGRAFGTLIPQPDGAGYGLVPLFLPGLVFLALGGCLTVFSLPIARGLEGLRAWGGKPLIEADDQ